MRQQSTSTRTAYRRSAGFGATRASIRAGELYEDKVAIELDRLIALPGWPSAYLRRQYPSNGGFVDFALFVANRLPYFIEAKSQWSLDAYDQLNHYVAADRDSVARICICKVYHPHIKVPEPVQCLRLHDLLLAQPGHLTIIPWSGRGR